MEGYVITILFKQISILDTRIDSEKKMKVLKQPLIRGRRLKRNPRSFGVLL